jgi:para-aminobenzoate synthetase/4-amino-4-deoxychorismate lyase
MRLHAQPYVLLEDRLTPDVAGRLYCAPTAIIRCDEPEGLAEALEAVEQGLARGLHVAGFLSYEAAAGLEDRLPVHSSPDPIAWFGLFEAVTRIAAQDLDAHFAGLGPPHPIAALVPWHGPEEHKALVEAVKALIAAGDIYQANLTYPIDFAYGGDPERLYGALRTAQPVAHGAFIALEDRTILSVSPELFLRRQGRQLAARPMKGTAPRGCNAAADRRAALDLRADPKQRAENLMITDLLRNDLSRVCKAGSVRTPALFSVETYPTFHALTSTVTGQLQQRAKLRDVLGALFPCGSIVGAPKIRAAQIITDLETRGRGVYTGAIGAIAPNGDFDFSVAIRTAVLTADGRGRYGVGGGIVADSDPASEFAETELKAQVLTSLARDHQLIETLRWSATDGFVRLEAHLSRLERSAGSLNFGLDANDLRRQLDALAVGWPRDSDRRVRILLRRSGTVEISDQTHIDDKTAQAWRVAVSQQRLDAGDPFLRHKTTHRPVHEAATRAANQAGFHEALLLNQHGRLADGARTSIFVRKDGRLLTPPLTDGALPGVLRQTLIDAGLAQEAPLAPDDLWANPLLVGNSLRGLRETNLEKSTNPA